MRLTLAALVLLAGCAPGAVPLSAQAADPAANFAGSNGSFTGNCGGGGDANLSGSENTVTIRGACRAFQIAGDNNRVLVEMAPNGQIRVFGKNNRVSWTSSGEVNVTQDGPGNVISRGN